MLNLINFIIFFTAKYIKNANTICTELPDIARICNAEDETQILLSYNGTKSTMLTIQKKFGVGQASVMGELIRNEYEFYRTSGFEFPASISKLKDNFKKNLGQSNETRFDWSNSPDNMWQEENSTPIKIQTKPGCSAEVFEIVGRCSFMDARPPEYVLVHICDGLRNETTVPIANNIVSSTYKEDILTQVHMKKYHNYKAGQVKNNAVKHISAPRPFAYRFKKLFRNLSVFSKPLF